MRFNFVCARALLTALSVTLLATACGGGGDASTGQQTTPASGTNHAPTISGTPPATATVGQAYSFTPTGSDADNDKLTYSVTNKPAWMAFDSASGMLSGTPTATGSFANIVLSVTDGKAAAVALTGFTLAVNSATAGAVTLNWAAPTQNSDGTALTDLSGYKIVYGRDAGNLDQSKSLPSTVNSTVVDNLTSGTWYFAIVSVNGSGTESAPTNVASANI
jgi:hypothetical protein